ncbi:MAG TPA: CinA family nicotinamide mononucleotide deamidase-related protein [Planctomycetota bacterium]|nr:CinA family nicotinamide mononucleotide deamidase-related protein [Planctomycetota bacterium]
MTLVAEILAIGDELVHGALLDTNSKWLAGELEAMGAVVQRFVVVSDDPVELRAVIADSCARADVVVATGGLGPTLDDRTRDVVADVLGGPLWFHEESWAQVQQWLQGRRRPVPESNRRQAMLPPGAVPIANPVGTAPGFQVKIGKAWFFAVPGVPREMKVLMRDHVLGVVAKMPGLTPMAQLWLRVLGPSEALLGERIEKFMVPHRNPAVGITASGGLLTIRIVASAQTREQAAGLCETTAAELRPVLGDWLFCEGTVELPEAVVQRLKAAGCTLALAESCTGGLAAARLVDVPGASAVFRGGVVAYADESKEDLLGVPRAVLQQHGAVSEPVAAAMAEGARARFGADVALSTTGVAGPDGGTAQKPVGMVCFALASADGTRAWTLRIPDLGRAFVRDRAVFEVWRALLARSP